MAVNKVDINQNRKVGQPASTADTGITWSSGSRPSVVEYKDGLIRKTVITVPAFTVATTAAAKGFGQRIYTLPEGHMLPIAARVELNSTTGAATAATAGEVGLGTTVASGAVAVLSGTAGFQNILDGKTLSNHVAVTPLVTEATHAAGGTSGTMDVIDASDSATPVHVHLNVASTFDATGGITVNSATVTLWWIYLGDA